MCPVFQHASCCQVMQSLYCVYLFLSSPSHRQCADIVLVTEQYTAFFSCFSASHTFIVFKFVISLVVLSPANIKSADVFHDFMF